ncbi:MAG: hypothetical protein ACXVCX_22105, partial [Ktedonobacterales bacterium]
EHRRASFPRAAEIGIEVVPRHPPLRGAGGRHDDQQTRRQRHTPARQQALDGRARRRDAVP